MRAFLAPAIVLMAGTCAATGHGAELPQHFVYLSDIDPTVRQDIRYAGTDDFTSAPVPGYRAAECVLTEEAAQALAAVQSELSTKGYGLLVYDCYRPAKAVAGFVEWASRPGPADPDHNPHVPRGRLIAGGYIGARSGHSSGSTIDLTLTLNGKPLSMGTGFDFFDPLAYTNSSKIPAEARANRQRLVQAMTRAGFANYRREWWHFRYRREPFAGKRFDFDIPPKTP